MQNLRKKKQVYTTTEHTVKLTGDRNKETDHYFNECFLTFLVGLYGPVLPLKLSPNSNRPEDKIYRYLSHENTHILFLFQNKTPKTISSKVAHCTYLIDNPNSA